MPDQFIYSQKNNFAGGELTPTIEGRTELSLYSHGVKKLLNFILLPSGGITRRPGTQYAARFGENFPKKIISVMFSRKLSYVLAFEVRPNSCGCMFFIDGLSLNGFLLKHNNADFTFKLKDFSYVVFQGSAYISFGEGLPIFKFSIDLEVLEKFYEKINNIKSLQDNKANELNPTFQTSVFTQNQEQRQAAREFLKTNKLFIIEPLKCKVNYFKAAENIGNDKNNGNNQNNNTTNNAANANATNPTISNPKLKPFNEVIYNADIDKINDELKALHEDSASNIHEKTEEVIKCKSIAVFENRLWCFGVNNNIHSIWTSYKGDFSDFRMAYKSLLEARNPLTAFSATFSSSTFDNVLWSIPFSQEMLLGTTDGIYVVKEGDRGKGEFIKIHKEIDLSVSPIKPVILGKTIFFVEGNNKKINSLYYSQEKGGYQIADITAYAEHLFTSGIVEITGINSPFSMIFVVLRDGSFASFTYSDGLKIMGWGKHKLGGDAHVLSIAPVCSKEADLLYFYVRRYCNGKNNFVSTLKSNADSYKEYLEILNTKYFSSDISNLKGAKRSIYADCYVSTSGNYVNDKGVIDIDMGDCAAEGITKGSSTKYRHGMSRLEDILKTNAITQPLNLKSIDILRSFKYKGKLLADYPPQEIISAENFLKAYYQDYLPIILDTLALSFAYLRLIGKLYSNLEDIFSGDTTKLPLIQESINEAKGVANEIIDNLKKIRTCNELQGNKGHKFVDIIEYIHNDTYSFDITIIKQLATLDFRALTDLAFVAEDIFKGVKIVVKNNSTSDELKEMRLSVASLEYGMLKYYAKCEIDKNKGLENNIREFFEKKDIGFYNKLKEISHPFLTPYIIRQIPHLIIAKTQDINKNTNKAELEAIVTATIQEIFTKLEKELDESKPQEITSTKRLEEIVKAVNDWIYYKLSKENKNYFDSKEFKDFIDNLVTNYKTNYKSQAERTISSANVSTTATPNQNSAAFGPVSPDLEENPNEGSNANANQQTEDNTPNNSNSEANANASNTSTHSRRGPSNAGVDEAKYRGRYIRPMPPPPLNAKEATALMKELKDAIDKFREFAIDSASLLMLKNHRILLKSILEDEYSIKFEKYLLSSNKYLPLFKKIFPALTNYDIANIVENTKSSFREVIIEEITNIYANMQVAVIGDNKLQEVTILKSNLLILKKYVRHLAIGFPYKSIMQTFPLIFAEEVEHMPKFDCEIGVKLYNTNGGYIEGETEGGTIERQYIQSKHIDIDNLAHYMNKTSYLATKEVSSFLSPTLYTSGWAHFTTRSAISPDISCTFVVDEPVPATVLKVYAKTKVLAGHKGL